jgi:hypothetical protein
MGQADIPSHRAVLWEARDVAVYLTDFAAQLEAMSAAVGLDSLAYLYGMAKAEGLRMARTAQGDEQPAEDPGRLEPIDPET